MTDQTALSDEAPAPDGAPHIVDQLIEERAVTLRRSFVWPAVRAVAYPLMGYKKAVRMADAVAPLDGAAVMNWARDFLTMDVAAQGVESVPAEGPVVIVANHPGGITDGVAVWDALYARRPDLCFMANRDAIRVSAGLADQVIPVEWRPAERSRAKARETLRAAATAFRAGRCMVIFPAGRMADFRFRQMGLVEPDWQPTAISLARKYAAPVVPLGVRSRLSWLFYTCDRISSELRNMTVFHELLAKKDARYGLNFGPAIDPARLPGDDAGATAHMRLYAQALAWGKTPPPPLTDAADADTDPQLG